MLAAPPSVEAPAAAPRAERRAGVRGRPDGLFALVGDVRGSSRALRQLRALRAAGLAVEVLTFGPPPGDRLAEGLPLGDGLRARVLPAPPDETPATASSRPKAIPPPPAAAAR